MLRVRPEPLLRLARHEAELEPINPGNIIPGGGRRLGSVTPAQAPPPAAAVEEEEDSDSDPIVMNSSPPVSGRAPRCLSVNSIPLHQTHHLQGAVFHSIPRLDASNLNVVEEDDGKI